MHPLSNAPNVLVRIDTSSPGTTPRHARSAVDDQPLGPQLAVGHGHGAIARRVGLDARPAPDARREHGTGFTTTPAEAVRARADR